MSEVAWSYRYLDWAPGAASYVIDEAVARKIVGNDHSAQLVRRTCGPHGHGPWEIVEAPGPDGLTSR